MTPYAPRVGTVAEALVTAIFNAGQIRTDALELKTGVPAKNIPANLTCAINAGLITTCKVDIPGKGSMNEYRPGPGRERPTSREYTPPKGGPIPVRDGHLISKSSVAPKAEQQAISAANREPQPAVGSNPGSLASESMPKGEAVSNEAQPPESQAKGRGMGPAATATPEGERNRSEPYFATDTNGTLVIDLPSLDEPLVLNAKDHLLLRNFINATPGIIQSIGAKQ